MKACLWPLVSCVILAAGCATQESDEIPALKREVAELKSVSGPPPNSLTALYPPKAREPIFLLGMHAMDAPLETMANDLEEGSLDRAKNDFEAFRTRYREVSKMVPEWEKAFSAGPVEELGAALESGDRTRIMKTAEGVGKVCDDCHLTNLPKAYQAYQWEEFSMVSVTDPKTGETLEFREAMSRLSRSFQGVQTGLERGEVDKARKYYEAFSSRFKAFSQTCEACHEKERRYFVDAEMQEAVARLGSALKSSSPDARVVSDVMRGIGEESCSKCHLVHVPAAYAKARWNAMRESQ